jgi:hypothetical protein
MLPSPEEQSVKSEIHRIYPNERHTPTRCFVQFARNFYCY